MPLSGPHLLIYLDIVFIALPVQFSSGEGLLYRTELLRLVDMTAGIVSALREIGREFIIIILDVLAF